MKRASIWTLGALVAAHAGLPDRSEAQNGYLFRAPILTLSLRAGASLSTANDPLHRFFIDELTLDKRDFTTVALGADAAIHVTPRIDLVASIFHSEIKKDSEFRDWVDANDLPIEQTTTLSRTPITAGVRMYLRERGHSLSRFAWVPTSFLPYVGAGAGVTRYKLVQNGWFVDHEDLDIFEDYFSDLGTTPTLYGVAGMEWWPAVRVGLSLEGRYSHARAKLIGDFEDFDHIDLGGFQLTVGFSTRF